MEPIVETGLIVYRLSQPYIVSNRWIMSEAIVEIRDYTIEPEWLDAYAKWADSLAAPWLRANLDVIDFWLDCGIEAEVRGSSPQVSETARPTYAGLSAGRARLIATRGSARSLALSSGARSGPRIPTRKRICNRMYASCAPRLTDSIL